MPDPDQIEDFLATKIAQAVQVSPDDALLGFLDVDGETQQAVLDALRSRPAFSSINNYLRRYPALTCYGLSVAVAIGLVDDDVGSGAIYGAWEHAIGFFPLNNERRQLAQDFVAALKRLELPVGTISPEHELHWKGGCYLFQGAVLPHFVEPLRAALDSAQRSRPLPDLEDPERVAQFAYLLASKVHPAQTRLQKTLRSEVGPFLIRRLIQWLLTSDNSLFPAHIQPLLLEQRKRAALVHAPYIQFNEDEGEFFLVLPAQTGNVADYATRWNVEGRQYRAASENPPLPLKQLGFADRSFEIKLTHLTGEREDCSYPLAGGMPDRGFRVFDAATGRERKIPDSPGRTLELPIGQSFWVVLGEDAEVQSDHEEEEAGDFRFVRYEATLGAEALVIENAGVVWTLKPKVRPGLYLNPSEPFRFRATRKTDQGSVYVGYGEAPHLSCVIPSDADLSAKLHFSTRFDERLLETIEIPSEYNDGPIRLIDLRGPLDRWVKTLPPAVHAITIRLECGNRRMAQEFFHWKGLDRITMYGDFRCDALPNNLEAYPGFEKNGCVIERPRRQHGKAELVLTKVGNLEREHWEVPANGVKIAIVSPQGGGSELEEGSEIEILPDDDRIVQLRTGGLLPIRLTCNGRSVGEISNEKPLVFRFLSAMAVEYGRTGVLRAQTLFEFSGETSWPVLSWCTPQTAKECRREESEPNQVIWLIRKVSITGVDSLRVRLFDLEKSILGDDNDLCCRLEIPAWDEETSETSLGEGFECSVKRKPGDLVQIRLSFNREQAPGQLWVSELECLLSGSTVWQPIMSREKYGRLATVRFLFIGATPDVKDIDPAILDLFWGNPKDALSADSKVWQLTSEQLDKWIACVRWLVGCKYPTPVWHQNSLRFESLYQRLSSVSLFGETEVKATWWKHAVQDLQRHAAQSEPVVIPTLLFLSDLKMAASSLVGFDPEMLGTSGLVERTIKEACIYEHILRKDDLAYVGDACSKQRLDFGFLSHFKGWQHLVSNRPVALGSFDYLHWSNDLADSCIKADFHPANDSFPLLSDDHFIVCQRKALRRAGVLLDVAEQDHGHWLSEPISQLNACRDRSSSALRSILGDTLRNDPADIFLRPFDPERPSCASGLRLDYLRSVNLACCLIALALRTKRGGGNPFEAMEAKLRSLIPNLQNSRGSSDKLSKQVSLVVGTAPELFSFCYLMFTLTLKRSS